MTKCAFVSDAECVIDCHDRSGSSCLRLFNVKTGDLLSVLDMDTWPSCLVSFPQKGLIAFGLWNSERMCAFIEVKLPRDKVNRKAKVRNAFVLKNYFAKISEGFFVLYVSNNVKQILGKTLCLLLYEFAVLEHRLVFFIGGDRGSAVRLYYFDSLFMNAALMNV